MYRSQTGRWLLLIVHVGMISAVFFLTVSFPVIFVALADKFTPTESLLIGLTGLAVLVAGIIPGGALADRYGPRLVSGTGFVLVAALAIPGYHLMTDGNLALALLGIALVTSPFGLSAGVYEAWTVSAFPTRYTGSAVTCNGVGIALFGLPSLLLASRLARDHGYLAPVWVLVAAGLIGALTTRFLARSIHEPLV